MDNVRKPTDFTKKTGMSNKSTFNCLNPNEVHLVMKGKDWVTPKDPIDFPKENKTQIKSIIQVNRERVKQMKKEEIEEGKLSIQNHFWLQKEVM